MKYLDRYPIIVTEKQTECRDFWARHLGFAVVFGNEWFVYMQADGASIAFMAPEHPSWPPGPEGYVAGISLELEVADATAALAEVRASGAEPDYHRPTNRSGNAASACAIRRGSGSTSSSSCRGEG